MIVTGTSRGLGRDVAAHYANRGVRVFGCSRSPQALEHTNYTHHRVDVSIEDDVCRFVRTVRREAGAIDALICNAGIVKSALLAGITPFSVFHDFMNVMAGGTFLMCREVVKIMAAQRNGRIVTVGSIMTELHGPGAAAYSAAKAAVVEFTKVLAREVAEYGVTCNVVSPSMIATESTEQFGQAWRDRMLGDQTLRRPVSVEELCHVIDFYLAPAAAAITGQVVHTCYVD